MEPTEADSDIEEEHLLNFIVNSLDDELAIDLGEDVEVTTETLYEVVCAVGVVTARLIPVKAGGIDRGMACAFLG